MINMKPYHKREKIDKQTWIDCSRTDKSIFKFNKSQSQRVYLNLLINLEKNYSMKVLPDRNQDVSN